MSEAEFQSMVIEAATVLGWRWVHFRPARTARGWATPVSGPLGEGWPDLFLARSRDARLLAVECKAIGVKASPMQLGVHEILRASGLDVRVWTPADWTEIEATLR